MNIEKRIKEELLDAAEKNVEGAEAFVLMIGNEDNHADTTLIGDINHLLSMLIKALDKMLHDLPDRVEKDLRIKIAKMILGGADDDAE